MIAASWPIPFNPVQLVRGLLRYVLFCGCLCGFLFHHGIVRLLIRDEDRRLTYFLWSIKHTCRLSLRILGIEVELELPALDRRRSGLLLIANHMSYVDVLVLFSHYPALFITSVEMREVPVLGLVAELAGCFFVERRRELRSETTRAAELARMNEKLAAGFDVFLFPEGTSSSGDTVLPFKSTFFQTAIDCQTSLVPICLRYEQGREVIPWYGAMTFPDHLFRLCLSSPLRARVTQLEAVAPKLSRPELRDLCYNRIKEQYETA